MYIMFNSDLAMIKLPIDGIVFSLRSKLQQIVLSLLKELFLTINLFIHVQCWRSLGAKQSTADTVIKLPGKIYQTFCLRMKFIVISVILPCIQCLSTFNFRELVEEELTGIGISKFNSYREAFQIKAVKLRALGLKQK